MKVGIKSIKDNITKNNWKTEKPTNIVYKAKSIYTLYQKDNSSKNFKKEHRGIEFKKKYGGSSMWWVTEEQGWMSMRGVEHDIQGLDEETLPGG